MTTVNPTLQGNQLEAVRYQLETVGYAEITLACTFLEDDATLVTIDGLDYGTTIPVPPDSTVIAHIMGAVFYNDDTNVEAGSLSIVTGAVRDGTGDVEVLTDVGGSDTFTPSPSTELSTETGAIPVTEAVAIDTTNQGLDITLTGDADADSGYFVGRAILVCAKNGGLPKAYIT